jgi:hypothetical protein
MNGSRARTYIAHVIAVRPDFFGVLGIDGFSEVPAY